MFAPVCTDFPPIQLNCPLRNSTKILVQFSCPGRVLKSFKCCVSFAVAPDLLRFCLLILTNPSSFHGFALLRFDPISKCPALVFS